MTSTQPLVDAVACVLFQNIRDGMESGRISDMEAAQTEVDAAIAELNRRRLIEGSNTHLNDLVGKLVVEISSLHEKVAKCESQLAEFQSRAEEIKQETSQIAARTEACNLLAEQQRKENAKVFAAIEGEKASTTAPPPLVAPAPSPVDPVIRPAPSRAAIISFPGGPRTVTIHPPDSPSYQRIIRDEKGDVIITLKGPKPLRREGAFRGPLEEIDWHEITRVYGRGPEPPAPRTASSVPRWPDLSQPSSSCSPLSRVPSGIIAKQRQLSASTQTDAFGRVRVPQDLTNGSSSSESSEDSQSSNSHVVVPTTPTSLPPSPSFARGKKRARLNDSEEGADAETREEAALAIDLLNEPTTPTPVKRDPLEGPTKPKKLRYTGSSEALTAGSLCRTRSMLDVTRAD